jgi:aspartyl-tRNA(Asn)/glutamyl-tRNA(Gln) amidotransferase subunit B
MVEQLLWVSTQRRPWALLAAASCTLGLIVPGAKAQNMEDDLINHYCTQAMNSDFAKMLNEEGITSRQSKITPDHLVELVKLIEDGTISGKIAKTIFAKAYETGDMPKKLVEASGATQISDTGAIKAQVQAVLDANPDVVAKYKGGNMGVKGFLVGQIMKATQGRANPGIVQQLLDELLSS